MQTRTRISVQLLASLLFPVFRNRLLGCASANYIERDIAASGQSECDSAFLARRKLMPPMRDSRRQNAASTRERIPLPMLSGEIARRTGKPAPGYARLYHAVLDGTLPASRGQNGRISVDEADMPAICARFA
jgi:hypothetical protein